MVAFPLVLQAVEDSIMNQTDGGISLNTANGS